MDPSEARVWAQRVQSGHGISGCSSHQLYCPSGPGIRELGRQGTTGSPQQREFGRELAKPKPQPVNGGELRPGSPSWKWS